MSLFKKKYRVIGWRGEVYYLTAKQLYETVEDELKSNYNWITSTIELVKVISSHNFPEEYAKRIKIKILNCFASLEMKREYMDLTTDRPAVYVCYNSLKGNDPDIIAAKNRYLNAIIKGVVKYDRTEYRIPLHRGSKYQSICNRWRKAKFDENISKEYIDFEKLIEDLYASFEKMIQTAEENGLLKEERREQKKRRIW